MDGAIERWQCVVRLGRKLLGLVTEKEVATCTGAGSNFRKVGSVAVMWRCILLAINQMVASGWVAQ